MSFGTTDAARARRVFAVLLGLLALLLGRTGYLQLVRGPELAARARRMQFCDLELAAPRGRILDRNGRPLAASYHACSLAADPRRVARPGLFASRVAFLLGEPDAAEEMAGHVREMRARGKRFVYLRRRVDRERAASVKAAGLDGLIVREEPRREFPHGATAAALLGVVGVGPDGRIAGLSGLERQFDARLRGVDGCASVFRSGRRELLYLYPETEREPRPGRDLVTTLDVRLQQIAEEGLDALQERHRPAASCAIVLDPRSGEILALAGRPAFDPRAFPDVSREALRIPAVQSAYELGSTLKPLIMAWALTCGVVSPGQTFDCGPGYRYFGGRRLRDVKAHGRIDLATILVKSSNIGIAQVGLALGIERTYAYFTALGFGRPTGVELPGEAPGRVTPLRDWTENYTLVSVSMGRELMLTPLQLARAYAALANGGRLVRPTLLRERAGAAARDAGRVRFSGGALAFVREAMERVVSREGTGRRARVPGVRVAGKTGTSEKYPMGSGKYVSSFVGIAPAGDPRLLVLVVADEPKTHRGLRPYGGVVAAPIVGEIVRRALPLYRDREPVALPESGVRHSRELNTEGKVRVAAVHRSSVWVGEGDSPAVGRNPDSVGAAPCRSGSR